VKPTGNHQMNDQEELIFKANHNSLAKPAEIDDALS